MIRTAFAPVADPDTRLLILGSLPGEASLRAARYYAHPRNAFWRLISPVIGRDLVPLAYDDRLAALRSAGVGLWDVIARAERSGSLDAAIRQAVPADLADFVGGLRRLCAVAFNGRTAATIGRRLLRDSPGLVLVDLPSSSPAHTLAYAEKAAAWAPLADFLTERI